MSVVDRVVECDDPQPVDIAHTPDSTKTQGAVSRRSVTSLLWSLAAMIGGGAIGFVVVASVDAMSRRNDPSSFVAETTVLVSDGSTTAAADTGIVLVSDAVAQYVRTALEIEVDPPPPSWRPVRGSNALTIMVRHDQSATAVKLANAYAEAVVDVRSEQLGAGGAAEYAAIDRLLAEVDRELLALADSAADATEGGITPDERRRLLIERRGELLRMRDAVELSFVRAGPSLMVVDRATDASSERPSPPSIGRIILIGGLGGALLGSLAANLVLGRRS